METPVNTINLVTGIVTDTKRLLELEVKLFRSEVREISTLAKRLAWVGSLALLGLLPSVLFLGLALAGGLNALTAIPMWQCYFLVFLTSFTISVAMGLRVKKLLEEGTSGDTNE